MFVLFSFLFFSFNFNFSLSFVQDISLTSGYYRLDTFLDSTSKINNFINIYNNDHFKYKYSEYFDIQPNDYRTNSNLETQLTNMINNFKIDVSKIDTIKNNLAKYGINNNDGIKFKKSFYIDITNDIILGVNELTFIEEFDFNTKKNK